MKMNERNVRKISTVLRKIGGSSKTWSKLRFYTTIGAGTYLLGTIIVCIAGSPDIRDSIGDFLSSFTGEPGVTVLRDISYNTSGEASKSKDPDLQKGDLYLPQNSLAKRPAVIIIHGGSWWRDSKADLEDIMAARYFAKHGYVAFDINYRQLGKGGEFPGDIMDAYRALAFLVTNREKWSIDADRLATAGFSSGGFAAMMAAYIPTPNWYDYTPEFLMQDFKIGAVASFAGPTDLAPLARNPYLQKYLRTDISNNIYRFASPLTHADTAVPTIFVHGIEDKNVPISQSEVMCTALQAHHIPATVIRVQGQSHSLGGASLRLALEKVVTFFDDIFAVQH